MNIFPLPQIVDTILLSSNGVTLVRTKTDWYLVGLDYVPGERISTRDPRTDFFGSASLDEARGVFLEFSGLKQRSGDANDLQVRDTRGEL